MACWAPGETPKYIKVFISGVKRGFLWEEYMGMPPNGYHDMVQNPSYPCQWTEPPGDFQMARYKAAPDNCYFMTGPFLPETAFVSGDYPLCTKHFTNMFTDFDTTRFYGGTAYLTTPAWMQAMIESITPMIDPDPRMELFPMANEQIIIRYAGKRDATNISIKFDVS